jgi:hypothetical protein
VRFNASWTSRTEGRDQEDTVTARESAERHAQDVVDGNMARIMGDFAGSAFTQLMGTGGPPQPTTQWEILSEEPDGDAVRFQVRYSNDSAALALETRWEQFDGGVWKIVNARKVDA